MIPTYKSYESKGDYNYNRPQETVQFADIKSDGDVHIRVKNGSLSNITSEGNVTLTMSDSVQTGNINAQGNVTIQAIQSGTPQHILDFLSKRHVRPTTTSSSSISTPVLKDRVEEKKEPTLIDEVIGSVVRCSQCGISSTNITSGHKIGSSKNTPNGIEIKDPANRTHQIESNGVYQIVNEGQGKYRMERISDHDHF